MINSVSDVKSQVYNADCLAAMRQMPDNAFDLAVVDPPYGGGLTDNGGCKGGTVCTAHGANEPICIRKGETE